jgi:hypothetical protein
MRFDCPMNIRGLKGLFINNAHRGKYSFNSGDLVEPCFIDETDPMIFAHPKKI